MNDFSAIENKKKLLIKIKKLLVYNFMCYVCLILTELIINYNFFSFNQTLVVFSITTLLISVTLLFLLLILLSLFIDTKSEPLYNIFNFEAKIDYYLRILAVVLTFAFTRTIINIHNVIYLNIFIITFFFFNFFIECLILRKVIKISETKIENIKIEHLRKISDEDIFKYRLVLEKGKKANISLLSIIFFECVLSNYMFFMALVFIIFSIMAISLLKDIYSLLYKQKAFCILAVRYAILFCSFIFVILINENIILFKFYHFSSMELSSIIGMSAIPLYMPIHKIYISLKLCNATKQED